MIKHLIRFEDHQGTGIPIVVCVYDDGRQATHNAVVLGGDGKGEQVIFSPCEECANRLNVNVLKEVMVEATSRNIRRDASRVESIYTLKLTLDKYFPDYTICFRCDKLVKNDDAIEIGGRMYHHECVLGKE